jgi:RNA polymerase sigma factor (sigma-70 family)
MPHNDRSTQIQRCIDHLRTGDPRARDELLACASERLTRLTRRMLRDFPGVHRWEETDDVLQNALLRLYRALDEVRPPTVADLFRLAAAQVRRELIDLARHYSGACGLGANLVSPGHHAGAAGASPDIPDTTRDPDRLAEWTDFHRAAGALEGEKREVFDLLFYQGLSQADAAALLGVSEATIKRRWRAARMRLVETLGKNLPGL